AEDGIRAFHVTGVQTCALPILRRVILLLEIGLVVAGLAVAVAAWQQRSALQQTLALSEERLVEVPAGATPGGMFNRLEDEGILRSEERRVGKESGVGGAAYTRA